MKMEANQSLSADLCFTSQHRKSCDGETLDSQAQLDSCGVCGGGDICKPRDCRNVIGGSMSCTIYNLVLKDNPLFQTNLEISHSFILSS